MLNNSFIYDHSWRSSAACTGMETDKFFPVSITSKNKDSVKQIFSLCKKCPVSHHCLYEAIVNEYDGIWGMTTFRQRKSFLRHIFVKKHHQVTLEECLQVIKDLISVDSTPNSSIKYLYGLSSTKTNNTTDIDGEYNE